MNIVGPYRVEAIRVAPGRELRTMHDFLDATAGWTGSPGPIREPRGNSKSL